MDSIARVRDDILPLLDTFVIILAVLLAVVVNVPLPMFTVCIYYYNNIYVLASIEQYVI